jgi:putative tryptophan/tyrosine transport system substrate-binding protein
MKRREFVGLIYGAVLAYPACAAAQQSSRIWRIGHVLVQTPAQAANLMKALEQRLSDLGYVQGRNIVVLTRIPGPQPDRVEDAIVSLVPQIDLLVVWGTVGGVAAKKVGSGVPTVFVSVGAPVEVGLVQSLAHPGGNMTGITFEASTETYGKRLQLLKEIMPGLEHVAVLGAAGDANVGFAMNSFDRVAPELGITLTWVYIKSGAELEGAFATMKENQAEALIVIAGALTYSIGTQIADLALVAHLPSCHAFKETAVAGGLISLGPDLLAMTGPAAAQIDRIIKGTSPAEIPVEQPTRYELYINLKTAGLLNLTIPQSILGRADEVIE